MCTYRSTIPFLYHSSTRDRSTLDQKARYFSLSLSCSSVKISLDPMSSRLSICQGMGRLNLVAHFTRRFIRSIFYFWVCGSKISSAQFSCLQVLFGLCVSRANSSFFDITAVLQFVNFRNRGQKYTGPYFISSKTRQYILYLFVQVGEKLAWLMQHFQLFAESFSLHKK